CRSGCSGSRQP
ncbi:unnamed protein product, partial [Allacma fusca]